MAKGRPAGTGKARSSAAKSSARAAPTSGSAVKDLIDDLVLANRILYDQKVMDGYGHVSARDPRDPNRFLMSRARAPGLVTAADIMEFGLDGEPVRDDGRPIYSERFIHSEAYKARPDVHGVVHTHSPTVVPFSVTQVPLKPIRAPFFYPDVPVFEIREAAGFTNLLISNSALGKALAQKLGNNSVALLRGHGNIVVGPTLRIAVYRAVYTEANAQLLLQAKMLGGPITYLAPEEAAIMESAQVTVRPGHGHDRNWELWASEALAHTGGRRR
jgi:HCOMODA/2-hydroxy-3-carboxy-muconic semialdehyde decarboxylase